ncbi:MAG: T9SS type A sorting domain-containing protein, partial [Bacteroidales bacterium]|nr:T9SS type A sorting domain-containing protein [Bacteroidales bacterium]
AVYDWDLNTCYGDQDNFYIITQEADTITGNAPIYPPNGVRFGSNHLNLVIRALGVNPGAITDIPEPDSEPTLSIETFDFRLYPNPVGEYTTIEFSVNDNSHVSIEIFDLSGKSVSLLLDEKQSPGKYKLIYEPKSIPNGIYLCKVTIDNLSAIKKMIIVR